jgi:hypothetical protein
MEPFDDEELKAMRQVIKAAVSLADACEAGDGLEQDMALAKLFVAVEAIKVAGLE